MSETNDITVLNIDEVPYEVSTLSEATQKLVAVYNEWNKKEDAARGEVAILAAAKQSLSAQIVAKVREETDEQALAAAVEVDDSAKDEKVEMEADDVIASVK